MPEDHVNDDLYVDANGCPTERISAQHGPDVILHYDEIPESDVTTVDGIRCTTPLRTVIDIAPELAQTEWEQIIQECFERKLFTHEEAMERTSRPDMLARPGAHRLRKFLGGRGTVD